jgi:hypothetical protein
VPLIPYVAKENRTIEFLDELGQPLNVIDIIVDKNASKD